MAQTIAIQALSPVSGARVLEAPRAGDAAWLTLLMAQAMAGPRRIDLSAVRRAYEPRPDDHPMIFALLA